MKEQKRSILSNVFIVIAMILTMTLSITWVTIAGENKNGVSEYLRGDVNEDRELTIIDVRMLLQRVINENYTEDDYPVLDYNQDGEVSIIDVRLLLQRIINGIVVQRIVIDKTSLLMEVGDTETLTAEAEPINASNTAITWESNDTSVATVNDVGKVTAIKEGIATITASSVEEDITAECIVTVANKESSISYVQTEVEKTYGDSSFTNPLTNTYEKTIVYSSSNTNVATINSSTGLVTIKNAGTTIITAQVSDEEDTATYTLVVNKATPKAPTAKTGLVYNGSSQALIDAGNSGVTWYYKTGTALTSSNYSTTGTTTIPTGTVGSYKVYYYTPGNSNYNETEDDLYVTTTIDKAEGSIEYETTIVNKTYGDEAFINELTNTGDGPVTYSSSNTGVATVNSSSGLVTIKAIGTTTITAEVVDSNNYSYDIKTVTYELNVVQSGTLVEPTAKSGLVYTGSAHTLVNPGSNVVMWYYSTNTSLNSSNYTSGSTSVPTGTNAGNYTIYYYTPGNNQYNPSDDNLSLVVSIGRKSIQIPTVTNATYDGSEHTGVATGTGYSLSGTYKATNAGNYTATAILNSNYKWSDGTTTNKSLNWTIEKASPSVPTAKSGLTYNGNQQELINAGGTSVTWYYNIGTELTSDNYSSIGSKSIPTKKSVGNYTIYYYTPGNNNYSEKSGTLTATLGVKVINVIWENVSEFTYNGTEQAPIASAISGVEGETINITRTTGINAGNYTSVATISSVTGGSQNKSFYKLREETTTKDFTINPKTIQYSTSNTSCTYDGQSHTFSLIPLEPTSSYTTILYSTEKQLTSSNYSSAGSTTKPSRTNAGTTTVYWYIHTSNTNYSDVSGTATISINKKPIQFSTSNTSCTYDGQSHNFSLVPLEPTLSYTTILYSTETQLTSSNYSSAGSTTKPSRTNAGTTTAYWYIHTSNTNYSDVSGTATISIKQASGSISYATTSVNKRVGDAVFTNPLTKTGDGAVTYSSSATNVATVDTTGKVTIKSTGTTTITATVANSTNYTYTTKKATYTLNVTSVAVTGISLRVKSTQEPISEGEVKYMSEGGKQTIEAVIVPDNATNKNVTWNSSNTAVGTITNGGFFEAQTCGDTIITATTADGNFKASFIYRIVEPGAIITSSKDLANSQNHVIKAGEQVTYTLKFVGARQVSTTEIPNRVHVNFEGQDAVVQKSGFNTSDNTMTITVNTGTGVNSVGHLNIEVDAGIYQSSSGKVSKKTVRNDYVASLNTTKTTNAITAVVGVANSFYIKNYTYYLDGSAKKSNSTTNEYTYTGLTNGQSCTIKVAINFYVDDSDTVLSGTISESATTGANSGVEIHFLDVSESPEATDTRRSSADMILIKTQNNKTILIDAGEDGTRLNSTTNKPENTKNGAQVLLDYITKDKKVTLNQNNNGKYIIDYFIASHADPDHVGGFTSLKNKGFTIENVVVNCNYADDDKNTQVLSGNYRTGNLIYVTAGNCLKVDNILLNIFFPYPKANVPDEFLTTPNKGGIRNGAYVVTGDKQAECKFDESSTIIDNYKSSHTIYNNHSIVTKLICGKSKALLVGDAGFPAEEILIGKVSEEIDKGKSLGNNYKTTWTTPGEISITRVPITDISCNSDGATDCFYGGYNNGDGTGLLVRNSNGSNGIGGTGNGDYKDSVRVGTYMNLVKDIMENKNWTANKVEEEYHLSRLTEKDLSADILKIGHHGLSNATSDDFLDKVKPNKIVVTSCAKRTDSVVPSLDFKADFRVRLYYMKKFNGKNDSNIVYRGEGTNSVNTSITALKKTSNQLIIHTNISEHSSNSYCWYNYVYTPSGVAKEGDGATYNRGITIKTSNGTTWNSDSYTNISNYIHDMFYYRKIDEVRKCNTPLY